MYIHLTKKTAILMMWMLFASGWFLGCAFIILLVRYNGGG